MKTRNGKIARLPVEIREQLNIRLADGEPGNRLVEWLNSNPAVVKVMEEQFDSRPINENNLSEWRSGGYEEWLTLHSFLDEARVLSENSGQCTTRSAPCDRGALTAWRPEPQFADTGISSDHLHIVLLAHHAHLLQNWEIMPESDFKKKLDALGKLTASIMNMRRAELQKARVQLQRERLELLREKQSLKSASSSEPAGVGALRQAQGLEQAKRVETAGGMSGQEASEPTGVGALRQAQGLEQAKRVETAGGMSGQEASEPTGVGALRQAQGLEQAKRVETAGGMSGQEASEPTGVGALRQAQGLEQAKRVETAGGMSGQEASEPTGVGALRQAQGLEQAKRVETAGGMSGQEASRSPAFTSSNAYPDAAETRQAPMPSVSPSDPGIPSSSDYSSAEGAPPLLSAPRPKSALIASPLSTRIQPEFPDRSVRFPGLLNWSDSAGLDLISPLRPCHLVTQLLHETDSVECTARTRHTEMLRNALRGGAFVFAERQLDGMHRADALQESSRNALRGSAIVFAERQLHGSRSFNARRMEAGTSTQIFDGYGKETGASIALTHPSKLAA